jgi:hypothetical protein
LLSRSTRRVHVVADRRGGSDGRVVGLNHTRGLHSRYSTRQRVATAIGSAARSAFASVGLGERHQSPQARTMATRGRNAHGPTLFRLGVTRCSVMPPPSGAAVVASTEAEYCGWLGRGDESMSACKGEERMDNVWMDEWRTISWVGCNVPGRRRPTPPLTFTRFTLPSTIHSVSFHPTPTLPLTSHFVNVDYPLDHAFVPRPDPHAPSRPRPRLHPAPLPAPAHSRPEQPTGLAAHAGHQRVHSASTMHGPQHQVCSPRIPPPAPRARLTRSC